MTLHARGLRTHSGRCFCGAVHYETLAEPTFACICHCESCRRATGGSTVAWVTFRASDVTIAHGTLEIRETSPGVMRGHCALCGTHVSYQHAGRAGEMDITLSTFDDPSAFKPAAHIWVSHKLPWVQISDGLPQYAENAAA